MYCWIGFRKKDIKFSQQEDGVAGTSSFNFFSLLGLAVEGVTSFTVAPFTHFYFCWNYSFPGCFHIYVLHHV